MSDNFSNVILVIIGLSGSGKSTLIRHINRLIKPTSSRILIDVQNVPGMTKDELIDFQSAMTR